MGCSSSAGSDSDNSLFSKKYDSGEKVGEGAFATVHRAYNRATGEERAVKVLDARRKGNAASSELRAKAEQEVAIWQRASQHEHCVTFYEVFTEGFVCRMVMEMCEVSLLDGMSQLRGQGAGRLSEVFHDMLAGVDHVSAQGIVHRDIKPANFLFGGINGETMKLCDFGLAVMMPRCGVVTGTCGSSPYMSPELIGGFGYTSKTDVWSLGGTAYSVLFDALPYGYVDDDEVTMKSIIKGVPLPRFELARNSTVQTPPPEAAIDLVKKLLERSQYKRCSASEALQHPFVRRADTEDPFSPGEGNVQPQGWDAADVWGPADERRGGLFGLWDEDKDKDDMESNSTATGGFDGPTRYLSNSSLVRQDSTFSAFPRPISASSIDSSMVQVSSPTIEKYVPSSPAADRSSRLVSLDVVPFSLCQSAV